MIDRSGRATGVDRGVPQTRVRLARLCTQVFDPVVLIVLTTFVVAIDAAGLRRGAVLGGTLALLVVALPYAVLLAGVRRGRYSDRHLAEREQRPVIMAFTLCCVVAALVLMPVLDAPRALYAWVAAMAAGLTCCLAISLSWKVSIHSACAAGAIASLAVLVHPALLALTPVVVVVAWSRVALERHTFAQVVVGACVGGAVGVLVAAVVGSG